MRMLFRHKKNITGALLAILMFVLIMPAFAVTLTNNADTSIDRIELVTEQINLLKSRYDQAQQELHGLQRQHDKQISQVAMEKLSKSLLDKALLDISVAKSNLDSITIELTDSQQSSNWLDKSVQEIKNQINVLNIFGNRMARSGIADVKDLHADLLYQKNLVTLEKVRAQYLIQLQSTANNILQLRVEQYNRLEALLKSHQLLHVKQQQVRDELAYQQQQNHWLQQLNILNARLNDIDPLQSKVAYTSVEREIYYTNENANYAYVESLMARYKDQMQQMRLAVYRTNSISLLNEISDQVQALTRQINKLDDVLRVRMGVLEKHINDLAQRHSRDPLMHAYLARLAGMDAQYQSADMALSNLSQGLAVFRKKLDQSLQSELSLRQGFPSFGFKTLLDLGKEMLLVPALTFQIIKSMTTYLSRAIQAASALEWTLFGLAEAALIFSMLIIRRWVSYMIERPSSWHDQLNSKWLLLQIVKRNFADFFIITNAVAIVYFFGVPKQSFISLFYLSLVWLIFKGIKTVSRLCLVETTNNTEGHDVKLYQRLKWIVVAGGVVTGLTVFVHQLPLIFELKILCDRLFLSFLVVVSLLLLKSWYVVPNLILSSMHQRHPYFQKSIRLVCVLIPIIMLANSVIGLFGFLNLVMTISWYEGVFLIVLIGYLVLRGLLSDGMEQLSGVLIQHSTNGWLWTEAFLKPIDKMLRVVLLLSSGAMLFLLYGWDGQSPIVERLTRLMHYRLASVLSTPITPLNIIELFAVISVFYWTARWTREFVYRLLLSRTSDMGIRNSIAILSQYSVILLGVIICLKVLGIDLRALVAVASLFAFGIGLGLRDLANNFACGFLILVERPLRVGDIVSINGVDGEVTHIGGRAVTVRTWDRMELVVPNTEVFNKTFTNWTAKDNIVRTVLPIKISRYDNPHQVKIIIHEVLANHDKVLKDPPAEVYLKEMNDTLMSFELRYFVNIRLVPSRTSVASVVLMDIWDAFARHGIKPPYPQHEVFIRNEKPTMSMSILQSVE